MGKIQNGIIGAFSGKVGAVVGTTWKGMAVMRSVPKKKRSSFSPAEKNQQAKFALMSKFLQPIIKLLNQSFKPETSYHTGFNKAYSYNIKNAITGIHPNLSIDFNSVLVSRGDLPKIQSPQVISAEPGQLKISWVDNSGKGRARLTDKIFIAAYNAEFGSWRYDLNLATRNSCTCKAEMPDFSGKNVHVYIGIISADGSEMSESIYTGEVKIIHGDSVISQTD